MPDSQYNLGRNYQASARLNFQHWLANYRQGYSVHPSIKLGDDATVADIGTGTGAWLFELAKSSPSWTLDGIDIDLSQFPNQAWLPSNVRGIELDIYDPLPTELHRQYDLVHIRLFSVNFKNRNPKFVIEQIMKMVKVGGWIQWTENDLWRDRVVKVSDDIKSESTEALLGEIMKILEPRLGSPPGWTARLPEIFEECGLSDVTTERVAPPPELWPAVHDNFLLGYQEVIASAPNGAEIRPLLDGAVAELNSSKRGIAIEGHSITVVGRLSER